MRGEAPLYPQVFGKYVLERELSRGGMARLLLATLRGAGGFEKRLVVKQIRDELAFDQEWVRRFVEEAKTTVALSHPNIVPVYELGVEQGVYFLAMELVEGVSVAELLRGDGDAVRPLTPEEGAYIGAEISRALDYAHRRMNVVHRDITPRNVMVDEEGQIKVIDFGIAAPAQVAGHEVFGSPGHMPPEQWGSGELGPATDVFAVAVLLMELWSGKPPFRRATPEECEAAMHEPHPRPSETDIRLLPLDDVIAKAMSLDAKERPQEAGELGRALRKFLSGIDTSDIARGLGERVRLARARAAEARAKRIKDKEQGKQLRPSHQSLGEFKTHTFALREEIERLSTSPPETAHGAPTDTFTRKLPASTPPPPPVPMAESPLRDSGAVKNVEAPLRREGARRPPWGVVALATVAIFAAGFAWVRKKSVTPTVTPAAASVEPSAPTPPREPIPPAKLDPPQVAPHPLPAPGTGSTTAPTVAVLPARARIGLFGDPGTRVSVDGVMRGACPIQELSVEPGVHEVRFIFDPTGESRGERIDVKAGERIVLRADFAGAVPVIRVRR